MRRALIIGGTGLIGRAVARRLIGGDWTVEVTGRDPDRMAPDLQDNGARFHAVDRDDAAAMAALLRPGADLVVDCACFTAAQARTLVPLLPEVGSAVMISSKAVYVDGSGHHVNSPVPPRFDGPIREDAPTVEPGDMPFDSPQGYGANKVAAERVLLDSGHPVTVLRASKVHGEGAVPAREWWVVRRVLDRRPLVLLSDKGRGIDHPTAAANLAALVETVAGVPGSRILNAADPDTPDAATITRTIAAHLGHEWAEILVDETLDGDLGYTPWSARSPITLDMSAAAALGYQPAGTYAETVPDIVDWLVRTEAAQRALDHPYFHGLFDYAAEDAYVSVR